MNIIAPTTGPVTSGYGVPHRSGGPIQYAVDWGFLLADPSSKNLRAVASGSIVYSGPASGWGMHSDFGTIVVLEWVEDGFTWQAIYCHCASVTASGQVTAGQIIAIMGATGRVSGIHTHFILRRNSITVNPLDYLSNTASNGATTITQLPASVRRDLTKAGQHMMYLGEIGSGRVAAIPEGGSPYVFKSAAEYEAWRSVVVTYNSMPNTPPQNTLVVPPKLDPKELLFVYPDKFNMAVEIQS